MTKISMTPETARSAADAFAGAGTELAAVATRIRSVPCIGAPHDVGVRLAADNRRITDALDALRDRFGTNSMYLRERARLFELNPEGLVGRDLDSLMLATGVPAAEIGRRMSARVAAALTFTPNTDLSPNAGVINGVKNPFPRGYCTWGAWQNAPWLGADWGGNAGTWASRAEKTKRFEVGKIPVPGAVYVRDDGPGKYGHVGVVTWVSPDGTKFGTIEMNTGRYKGGDAIHENFDKYDQSKTYEFVADNVSFIYQPGHEPG
jgi:surface antigen